MSALQLRETDTMDDWQIMTQQASMLVKTGFLPQAIKTPEQAVAIILTGRELGIGTMAALNNIAVIQGKPTVSPQLMLALINRTNQVEDVSIQTGADGATCTIKRKGRSPYTARFGPKEAAAMGLSGKDNYKKQPATMYKWRAVAEAVRFTFSDVTLGLYTPEEMGAAVEPESGEIWEAPPEVGPPVVMPEPTPAYIPADEPDRGVVLLAELKAEVQRRQEAAAEAEPEREPTRSKAPQATDATTRQINALLGFLKWDANALAKEIYTRFNGLSVSDTDTGLALEALSGPQKKELLQALESEKTTRTGGRR